MAAKGGAATALAIMVVLVVMIAGQVSAASPTKCMIECLGAGPIKLLDLLYCNSKCGFSSAKTLAVDHTANSFCKLGCISHKCAVLFSNSGEEAVKGCVHGCAVICSSPTNTINPIKMGRNPVV